MNVYDRVSEIQTLRAEGLSLRQIGDRFGVSNTTIFRLLARVQPRKGDAPTVDCEEARRLQREGMTYAEIGARLGITRHYVRVALVPGVRERDAEKSRARHARKGDRVASVDRVKTDRQFVEPHRRRPVRQIIDREAIRQIIAERNGSIPVAELMARVTI